jgi:hypothetical protein
VHRAARVKRATRPHLCFVLCIAPQRCYTARVDDPPRIRVWIRATWRLANGREITRTVKREVVGDPRDEERRAIVLRELLEEVQDAGYALPEGHGALVTVLGAMTD